MNNPGAVDSNIFIYCLNTQFGQHESAKNFISHLPQFFITPQNTLEIYNVITDPRKFPMPFSATDAHLAIKSITELGTCVVVYPSESTWENTLALVSKYKIQGFQKIYDCYLATTLLDNHIETFYTANVKDFSFFPFISPHNPLN